MTPSLAKRLEACTAGERAVREANDLEGLRALALHALSALRKSFVLIDEQQTTLATATSELRRRAALIETLLDEAEGEDPGRSPADRPAIH